MTAKDPSGWSSGHGSSHKFHQENRQQNDECSFLIHKPVWCQSCLSRWQKPEMQRGDSDNPWWTYLSQPSRIAGWSCRGRAGLVVGRLLVHRQAVVVVEWQRLTGSSWQMQLWLALGSSGTSTVTARANEEPCSLELRVEPCYRHLHWMMIRQHQRILHCWTQWSGRGTLRKRCFGMSPRGASGEALVGQALCHQHQVRRQEYSA